MTTRELKELEKLANRSAGKKGEQVAVDAEAIEWAEGQVSNLSRQLGEAKQTLAALGGFCEDDLSGAIVGAIAMTLMEAEQQVRPLREAVRDTPRMGGGKNA